MVRLRAPPVLRTDPDLALSRRHYCSRRPLDQGFEFLGLRTTLNDPFND